MQKLILGKIHADYLYMDEAIQIIAEKASIRCGGYVVTPNVDHVVQAEKNAALVEAYKSASLSLCDGKPLVWISAVAGKVFPEKISGSDLVRPLLKRLAHDGLSVYFLGSAPGIAARAAEILTEEIPDLKIVGVDSPPMGFEQDPRVEEGVLNSMLAADPDVVLMALGAPKQELLMYKWQSLGVKQFMLGIGASLDFIAGKVKRAPSWMSNAGLEWLFRLSQDPIRLAKRYLLQDLGIFPVFLKILKTPKEERFL